MGTITLLLISNVVGLLLFLCAAILYIVLCMEHTEQHKTIRTLLHRIDDLKQKTLHDPLTGLANRVLFDDRLEQAFKSTRPSCGVTTRAHRSYYTLLNIDVNNFKPVNDTFGHTVGDKTLQEVAHRLQAVVRPGDTVARVGGDEFAILLQGKHSSGVIRRLVQQFPSTGIIINKFYKGYTSKINIGISVGAVRINEGIETVEQLSKIADRAMYRAKDLCSNTGFTSGYKWGAGVKGDQPWGLSSPQGSK